MLESEAVFVSLLIQIHAETHRSGRRRRTETSATSSKRFRLKMRIESDAAGQIHSCAVRNVWILVLMK